MKLGIAIITFVLTHLILRAAVNNQETSEVAFYFWPALLAVGMYLIF